MKVSEEGGGVGYGGWEHTINCMDEAWFHRNEEYQSQCNRPRAFP